MNELKSVLAWLAMSLICTTPNAAAQAVDNTAAASKAISAIEGVYKHRFTNALISGEQFQSEDVIEIMSYSPDAIYFRIQLQFFNGHSCGIYGIAEYDKGSFVYTNHDDTSTEQACTLTIRHQKKWLNITDAVGTDNSSSCRFYCGMRGSLRNYDISMSKKRSIKYLPLIKNSRQFRAAVDEFERKSGRQ